MNKNGSDFTLTKMALEGPINACENRVAERAN